MKSNNPEATLVETYFENKYEIVSGKLSEEEELYKENILDHYKNPHNKRKISHCTFNHKDFNPLCGDEITLFIKTEQGKIIDAAFEGNGCAISQASASMLTDHIKKMSLEQAKQLGPWDIFNLLGIRISHTRSKCALLCLKTLQEGIKEAKL